LLLGFPTELGSKVDKSAIVEFYMENKDN
jgi:hypothetical protein